MKPDACSIALFSGTRVFLIERAKPPFAGMWTLPGGRVEPGESATDCIKRELFEETGFVVEDPWPVLTQTIGEGTKRFELAVFAGFHPFNAPLPCGEIAAWEWVEIDSVGALRTTGGLAEVIRACAERMDVDPIGV